MADPYAAIAHDPYASIASPAAPTPTPSPKPGKSLFQNIGDVADRAYRNVGAARTAAARDPVGAAFNVLGAPLGALEGIAVGHGDDAMRAAQAGKDPDAVPNDLASAARDAWRGATDPVARNRYSEMINEAAMGPEPTNPTMPQRIARGVGALGVASVLDPVTHGGGKVMELGGDILKPILGAVASRAPEAVANLKHLASPEVQHAVGVVAHAIGKANPLPGMVNATKDLLFLNPFPHGLGNMTFNDWLANGVGTAAKGLWYGVRGTPKATADELTRIGAGAYTPELMGDASPWGPVGWMTALAKKGAPVALRGGAGAVAGGAVANQTAPGTATPSERAYRDAEWAVLGAITGMSPELRTASNKLMSRLEMGHRGAMFEGLPKPIAAAAQTIPKVAKAAIPKNMEQTVIKLVQNKELPTEVQQKIFTYLKGNPGLTQAQKNKYLAGVLQQAGKLPQIATKAAKAAKTVVPADPRAAAINAIFGGGEKSPVAKVATAAGGPYAGWQADVVPRVVGGAMYKAPQRVAAIARGQDITNRQVLAKKPYKLQVGGPVGAAAEMAFNTPKYAARLFGPLGNLLGASGDATNPQTLSAKDKIGSAIYDATPGRSAVGPFFGDTMYPSKAPAIPSAALSTLLGWHFANKTPRQDAILSIMKASGLDATQAASVYDRYKK